MEKIVSRRALSLVEVLVTFTILGLMVQLMLPAVAAARESARRLVCSQKLRRLAAATRLHVEAKHHFPSGGWHFTWVGEPERGTGKQQPGGWAYNLLDYLDGAELRRLGQGVTDPFARAAAIRQRCTTPLAEFICPSRRSVKPYPHEWNRQPFTQGGPLAIPLEHAAKTDYAANVGDSPLTEFDWRWQGPTSLTEGDNRRFAWPSSAGFTGVIYGRSWVRPTDIRDGESKTYLIGEKFMDAGKYETGNDWGDNENLFTGFNNDSCRSTLGPPIPDLDGKDHRNQFGSAHVGAWLAARCDGSVHAMSFEVDLATHRRLGNIRDGSGPRHQRGLQR